MRILYNTPARQQDSATVAQVTFSEGGDFGAASTAEQRSVPVFAPRGVAYTPCEGDNLLLLSADGREVCVGVLGTHTGLVPGELRLVSAGGASIHLKNNGDIVLNGLVIDRHGNLPVEG